MKDIVIIDGARTAFGTYGGALRDTSATDLGVVAAKAALEKSRVDPKQIDHVIFGNVLQTSGDAVYFARHIGLRSGVPKEVPALTVNRLCGSGLQAILLGAQEIQLGQADFVLAGGAENMSMAPHQIRGARWGLPLGEQKLEDYLWVALVDSYNGLGMANTAENLGRKYGITREAADEFAFRSHMLAAKARESCRVSEEIVPGSRSRTWTSSRSTKRSRRSTSRWRRTSASIERRPTSTAARSRSGIRWVRRARGSRSRSRMNCASARSATASRRCASAADKGSRRFSSASRGTRRRIARAR